jgi:hypothetical protein
MTNRPASYDLVPVFAIEDIKLIDNLVLSSYEGWQEFRCKWTPNSLPKDAWKVGKKCLWLVKPWPKYVFLNNGIPHRIDDAAIWQATGLDGTDWVFEKFYVVNGRHVSPQQWLYETTNVPRDIVSHINQFLH